MRKLFYLPITLAIAAAVSLLAPTVASSQDAPVAAPEVMVPADWLSIADMTTLLTDSGWTVVEIEAEIDEGKYEACLIGADGGEVEADIDPVTGEITNQEPESCGDEDGEDEGDDDADADEDADDTADADAAGGADD